MYILIMPLWFGYPSYTPVVTTTEVTSEKACHYAGAQQELALRNDLNIKTSFSYNEDVCPFVSYTAE